VLVIHGDTHSYKLDRPLRDPAGGGPPCTIHMAG
jgi:hypothetical protein